VEKVNRCCCGWTRRLECELVIEYETVGLVAHEWVYVVVDDHMFQNPRDDGCNGCRSEVSGYEGAATLGAGSIEADFHCVGTTDEVRDCEFSMSARPIGEQQKSALQYVRTTMGCCQALLPSDAEFTQLKILNIGYSVLPPICADWKLRSISL